MILEMLLLVAHVHLQVITYQLRGILEHQSEVLYTLSTHLVLQMFSDIVLCGTLMFHQNKELDIRLKSPEWIFVKHFKGLKHA